jgi:hypothetical protein
MDYMISLYSDENIPMPEPGTPEFGEFMGAWMAYNQTLIDGGHWIAASNLMPTMTATTIRKATSGQSITDGPFAETKEQFGGFYLISANDLDQALVLAGKIPLHAGSIEVRPVAFRPDAPQGDDDRSQPQA